MSERVCQCVCAVGLGALSLTTRSRPPWQPFRNRHLSYRTAPPCPPQARPKLAGVFRSQLLGLALISQTNARPKPPCEPSLNRMHDVFNSIAGLAVNIPQNIVSKINVLRCGKKTVGLLTRPQAQRKGTVAP